MQILFSDAIERASSADEGGSGYQWCVYSCDTAHVPVQCLFWPDSLDAVLVISGVWLQNLFSDAIERASSGDEGGSGYQWYVYSYQAGYLLRRATFMLEKLGTIHLAPGLCKQLNSHSCSNTLAAWKRLQRCYREGVCW